jgi:hypothetical protein
MEALVPCVRSDGYIFINNVRMGIELGSGLQHNGSAQAIASAGPHDIQISGGRIPREWACVCLFAALSSAVHIVRL